ncbi:ubiquitin-conjugating enzyme E2 28-like [Eutrema salsugineum]|uniref:ubiquitin-conjugating enzyme E2 28-like n=1 Tax=Eutrema salsugineum TaxID=72664 RepID=UPI000CED78FE|nr:ubiquitin-conjugating enzyme E2 28-like [Eutrema salsugineum]
MPNYNSGSSEEEVPYWERAMTMHKKKIERVKSPLYSTCPVNGNMFYWEAVVFGPAGSPYENGVFKIGMHFPPEYPFKPPKVFFRTKIFYPNVGDRGHIFLRMLTNDYFSLIYTINQIFIKLHEMLTNPEIGEGDYYDEDKTKLYKEDKAGFDETARECTLEHAGASKQIPSIFILCSVVIQTLIKF